MSKYKVKFDVEVFGRKIKKIFDVVEDLGMDENLCKEMFEVDEFLEDSMIDVLQLNTNFDLSKKIKGRWVYVKKYSDKGSSELS